MQKQIEVLIGAAVVLAVLTWVGSATDLLGLLRDWVREKREEESTPVLQFDGFTKTAEPVTTGNAQSFRNTYFVKVRKEKGEGYAKDCEGFLTVAGTSFCNVPTVWAHGEARQYNIGGRMDLRLFTVERYLDRICLPAALLQQGHLDNPLLPYDEHVSRILIIEIHAAVGRPPTNLTKKIADIIQEASQE